MCNGTLTFEPMASRKRFRSEGSSASTSNTGLASRKRCSLSAKVGFVAESAGHRFADKGIFCPHCDATLSSKTFRRHKSLYFSQKDDTWMKMEREDEVLSPSTG